MRPETPETVAQSGLTVHHATLGETLRDREGDSEVTARLAALEAEVRGMRELLAEVKQSRDEWKDQANRLVHALPAPESKLADEKSGRPWWKRLVG
jgi:hypothetical protein